MDHLRGYKEQEYIPVIKNWKEALALSHVADLMLISGVPRMSLYRIKQGHSIPNTKSTRLLRDAIEKLPHSDGKYSRWRESQDADLAQSVGCSEAMAHELRLEHIAPTQEQRQALLTSIEGGMI